MPSDAFECLRMSFVTFGWLANATRRLPLPSDAFRLLLTPSYLRRQASSASAQLPHSAEGARQAASSASTTLAVAGGAPEARGGGTAASAVTSTSTAILRVGALRVLALGTPQPSKPAFHDRHVVLPLGFTARRACQRHPQTSSSPFDLLPSPSDHLPRPPSVTTLRFPPRRALPLRGRPLRARRVPLRDRRGVGPQRPKRPPSLHHHARGRPVHRLPRPHRH